MAPRERSLSLDELKCLGFVLDHAKDRQVAVAIRLLLFTGAWLEDSKTGPRTIWLGPEAARLLAALPGLHIHDCRHAWASQGVVNGVALTTVGGCSDTASARPRPSMPISTILRCRTRPHKPRRSSPAPWDTKRSRRQCRQEPKKRTMWEPPETARSPMSPAMRETGWRYPTRLSLPS